MSIRSATRQEAEGRSVPSLQIVPRLEAPSEGDGAALRTPPSFGLRAALLALLAALAAAAAVMVIGQRSHHGPGGTAPVRASRRPAGVAERQGAAGLAGRTVGPVLPAPGASVHYLSASALTSLAAGASSYRPAPYLESAYRTVAARYRFPWRLLAAVEYIRGGYTGALAGASAEPERAAEAQLGVDGQRAINADVLAHAEAAAAGPSAALELAGRQLAADGAARSPAQAAATYMQGTGTSAQAVLTLAQEIGSASITSASPPPAKVAAMLSEARLLNRLPYVWGGGHTVPAWVVGAGYDCSGFVSAVLHSGGYLNSPETTQTLPGAAGIVRGRGRYVTIYDRTIATLKVWVKKRRIVTVRKAVNSATIGVHVNHGRRSDASVAIRLPRWVGEWKTIKLRKLVPSLDTTNNDEHVIIDIGGQWWESGGSSADGGAAMVHRIADPSRSYLKSFNRILHPQGL